MLWSLGLDWDCLLVADHGGFWAVDGTDVTAKTQLSSRCKFFFMSLGSFHGGGSQPLFFKLHSTALDSIEVLAVD